MGRLYETARWRRVARRVLACAPVCQGCGERPSAHADHIVPLSAGGAPYDRANLQALCVPCHNQKTGRDQIGLPWLRPLDRGCDVDGRPRASFEPGGGSITSNKPALTGGASKN